MWRRSFRSIALRPLSSFLPSPKPKPFLTQFPKPKPSISFKAPIFPPPPLPKPFSSQSFSDSPPPSHLATTSNHSDLDDTNEEEDDGLGPSDPVEKAEGSTGVNPEDIKTVVSSLRDFSADSAAAKRRLEQCGVAVSRALVREALSRFANDWGAAFTFFLWAATRPGYAHSAKEYDAMIVILGKMRRFDTAWSLVREMKAQNFLTPHTLMILIRRYSAVHDVGKAIHVFYSYKKFGFVAGTEDFHGLLNALCRYKNVEDAEHLLLCNESTFPFETKGFNIVLNGWCNVLVRLREARRFWRAMGAKGIPRDAVSYGSMISCKSKAGNLNDVLKLFSEMKELGIEPDLKVYNAVIYALSKAKCIMEAKDLVKIMEEKGVAPTYVTYNSIIRPLCKAGKLEDAQVLLKDMISRGLNPSVRTYHAIFDLFKTEEQVFNLLKLMRERRCFPVIETYNMMIRKLCRWKQKESVYRLWNEMIENGMSPDRSSYIVLIHGLFLNGWLEDAFKYYKEMTAKGFSPEPKTEQMIQAWLAGKEAPERSEGVKLEADKVSLDPTPLRLGDASLKKHEKGLLSYIFSS